MKVVCIMQARVGSSRLPGKVLKEICGKTVLEHDINRLKLVKSIDEIVVATTIAVEDEKIVKEAKRLGIKYFRGSESDVLSRYYYAAKESNADIVIRVTSDCPCLDYEIVEDMINTFKYNHTNKGYDYLTNALDRTFPRGYDCEVFTFEALKKAFLNAKKDFEREHVTPYIYGKEGRFKIYNYRYNNDYSMYRVTLDTEEDLQLINTIYINLYKDDYYFLLEDVLEFLDKNPSIAKINENIEQKKLGE